MKLQRYLLSGIVGLLTIVGVGSANAGLITNVTSSNNAVAQVTGVTNSTYTPGLGPFGTGGVTIDLSVFRMHTPIQLTFAYAARPAGAVVTDYNVVLRVTNLVSAATTGLNFNGFDITNSGVLTPDVISSGVLGSTPITSNRFAVLYSGGTNIPNGFRWGGLNGGGPRLAIGDTATNTFTLRTTWGGTGAGTSTLNFVANPEPATILLGSLAMVPAGIAAHRRRKNAKAAAVPAV
jgi:hypothetical protein